MKNLKITGLLILLLLSAVHVQAQDEAPLTDDELTKYASVMLFADTEKAKMGTVYNERIKGEELMNGGRRFKEIKDAKGDDAKLQELNVTEEELAVFNSIQEEYEAMVATFKEAYTAKIKDKEVLGAGLYNRIRKELKTDADLKARYDAIFEQLKANSAEGEEAPAGDGSN